MPKNRRGRPSFLKSRKSSRQLGWGDDGYAQSFCFEDAAYDGGSKRRVIHVGVTAEKYYIQFVPTT